MGFGNNQEISGDIYKFLRRLRNCSSFFLIFQCAISICLIIVTYNCVCCEKTVTWTTSSNSFKSVETLTPYDYVDSMIPTHNQTQFFFFFLIHLIPLGQSPMPELTYANCLHASLSSTWGSSIPKGWVFRSDVQGGSMTVVAIAGFTSFASLSSFYFTYPWGCCQVDWPIQPHLTKTASPSRGMQPSPEGWWYTHKSMEVW